MPLTTLDTLTLPEPILGTNVFLQFLTTLDYPRDRIVLSPRGDEALAAEHRADLGDPLAEVPFYLWSDHFMFVRGGLGERADLNFFVDSGLVSLDPMGQQAAIMASAARLESFGAVSPDSTGTHLPLLGEVRIGALAQPGHLAFNQMIPIEDLGGLDLHALTSHAWLQAYAWTLDFEARTYTFSP